VATGAAVSRVCQRRSQPAIARGGQNAYLSGPYDSRPRLWTRRARIAAWLDAVCSKDHDTLALRLREIADGVAVIVGEQINSREGESIGLFLERRIPARRQLDRSRATAVASSTRKRITDIVLSLAGLIALSPILALIALAILLDSGLPVLYGQRRVAMDRRRDGRRDRSGRTFVCWKFRTMVRGADGLREPLASRNVAPFPAFKIHNDPRVTRVGYLLRRSSLDELPQLWNVLRGEMSLVGPRPPLPEEAAAYDDFAMQRLWVRPGLTCFWQIENRESKGSLRFEDWVQRDLAYIENWDIGLDLKLIARTMAAVARMTGQ
jgi:lipopolysaccharide/colanic/teichoic acid biosynthesis glycosyltransferase